MNNKLILLMIVMMLSLTFISAESVTIQDNCPVWYNPLTWFRSCDEFTFEKNAQWIKVYSDDNDLYEVIPDRGKQDGEIYLCSKSAKNAKDLKEMKLATSKDDKGKKLDKKNKVSPVRYNKEFCYKYNPTKDEKFVKFGKHSTHFAYTNESISYIVENETLSELSLITDDFGYKDGKPHISLGFGSNQLTHVFHVSNYSENAITDLRAIDMNTNEVVDRNLRLKYLTYEIVEVDTYYCSEELSINGTIQEVCEVNGTREVSREKWLDFVGVEGEDYILGVFADTQQNDYIDIAFNFNGIAIEESPLNWATWDSDLEVDLISWYKLDETTGDVIDSHGSNDGTNNGATRGVTGQVGDAFDFTGGVEYVDMTNDASLLLDDEYTISAWINMNSFTCQGSLGYCQVISKPTTDSNHQNYDIRGDEDPSFEFHSDNGLITLTSNTSISTGIWNHLVAVKKFGAGGFEKLYLNGDLVASGSDTDSLVHTAGQERRTLLGGRESGGEGSSGVTASLNGDIDEIGIWSRALTSDEITQLYNSGDGITYSGKDTPTLNLTIDKTSPQTYGETINISCATDSNSTLKMFINDTDFTSSLNTDITLGVGYWDIKCNVTENDYWASAENETNFTINKATPTGTIDGSSPIGETSPANIEGLESNTGDSDVNYTLYRNGTYVSNPDTNNTLEADTYFYVWNNTAGQNYTATSQLDNFTLEVVELPTANVTLYSPEDGSNIYNISQEIDFVCEVLGDGSEIENVSLMINDVINQTNSSGIKDVNYTFSETFGDGNYTWTCKVWNNFSLATEPTSRYFHVNTTSFIDFISPTPVNDTEVIGIQTLDIKVNITQPVDYFKNWTFYVYNTTGLVDSYSFTNSTRELTYTYPRDGNYTYQGDVWTITEQYNTTQLRYIYVDFETPEVNITSPEDGYVVETFNESIDLNWTVYDFNLESCFYADNNEIISAENTGTRDQSYYNISGNDWVSAESDIHATRIVPAGYIEVTAGTALQVSEITSTGNCLNATYYDNNTVHIRNSDAGDYFCVIDENTNTFQFEIIDDQTYSVESYNHDVECYSNSTSFNYPSSNPDSKTYYLYASDSIFIGSDEVTILKNTTAPTVTVTSPEGDYGLLFTDDSTLDLNFSVSNNVTPIDKCWFDYNGTNITLTDCGNTTFDLEADNQDLILYANDTLSNLGYQEVSWTYRGLEIQENYVNETTSGAINEFGIDFQTNGTAITLAYLYYNDTRYLGSIASSGNIYNLTRSLIAPNVDNSTNFTFYWNITMADGYTFTTRNNNQTVNPLEIVSVCSGNYTLINMTLVDENTREQLNETSDDTSIKIEIEIYSSDRTELILSYNTELNNTNPAAVCLNDNLTNGQAYSVDYLIQYTADNSSTELYYIQRDVLNETTMHKKLTLYDLSDDNAQEFKLIARDKAYLPYENALIQIERKYIENGSFYVTEVPKTDEQGSTSASLELNDVIYNFYIYLNGELQESFTNVIAVCQTPLVTPCEIDFNSFQGGLDMPDFEEGDDFNFDIGYNKTSKILSASYTIPSDEPSEVQLVVTTNDALSEDVCTDVITSASGYLYCTIGDSFGNSTVTAKLYKDDVEVGKGIMSTEQSSSEIYGVILVVLSIMVMMTLMGIGLSDNPVVSIFFIFIGIVLLGTMNLIESNGFVGAGATILFMAIAMIIFLIKAARRS